MNNFHRLLEELEIDEMAGGAIKKAGKKSAGRKLGGGVKVRHDAQWKRQAKLKKKWSKTSAGKRSAKKSDIRTSKTSYKHKTRQGIHKAKT